MYIIKNVLEVMGLNLSYYYSNGRICFIIYDCVFNSFYDLEEDNEELFFFFWKFERSEWNEGDRKS